MDDSKQQYEPVSQNGLDESFIATATAVGASYIAEARPYLEVVAPATLPEGYTFEAEANGQTFMVKVPVGGVEEGQTFPVQIPIGSSLVAPSTRSSVPVGYWKDDLCSCCGMGCCHPTVCMACCFPIILLGQVMQRLKLTWLAGVGQNPSQTSSTFRILFSIGITSIVLRCLQYILAIVLVDKKGEPSDSTNIFMLPFNLIYIVISLFYLVLLCRTRRHIREKYQIPEQQCHGCEDCCCSYWCSCCTLAQMARHTGDYAAHGSRWCSETGMAPGAPSIV